MDTTTVKWIINSNDSSDIRGYDSAGEVIHWLDSKNDLKLFAQIVSSCENTKYTVASLSKRPVVVPRSKLFDPQ